MIVDLAPEGELSTALDWAVFLQKHLTDLAAVFRPVVIPAPHTQSVAEKTDP